MIVQVSYLTCNYWFVGIDSLLNGEMVVIDWTRTGALQFKVSIAQSCSSRKLRTS